MKGKTTKTTRLYPSIWQSIKIRSAKKNTLITDETNEMLRQKLEEDGDLIESE